VVPVGVLSQWEHHVDETKTEDREGKSREGREEENSKNELQHEKQWRVLELEYID
jgi:hypothetical protein